MDLFRKSSQDLSFSQVPKKLTYRNLKRISSNFKRLMCILDIQLFLLLSTGSNYGFEMTLSCNNDDNGNSSPFRPSSNRAAAKEQLHVLFTGKKM